MVDNNIRDDAVSFDGDLASECYVIVNEDVMNVFCAERGRRSRELVFQTEHEACSHLISKLSFDKSVKKLSDLI